MSATAERPPSRGRGAPAAAHGNYIAGEWRPAASGRTFENRNPADRDDLIGTFAESAPEDVERGGGGGARGLPPLARRCPRPSAARSSTAPPRSW